MSDDKKDDKETIERVQFERGATAAEIADGISSIQDEWAKKYPDRAHKLYPKVYNEKGERIKKD